MSEVKYIVPDLARTFGKLEFGGEMDVSRRRVNGRSAVLSREYSLFSSVQRADNVSVVLPVGAGEKRFEYEEEVALVNPKIYAEARVINSRGFTEYVLKADDMVRVKDMEKTGGMVR